MRPLKTYQLLPPLAYAAVGVGDADFGVGAYADVEPGDTDVGIGACADTGS